MNDTIPNFNPAMEQRTFIALLEDKPGALNRVVSLFRRRDYNIVSLNVGRTHEPGLSRLTVVVDADARTADQLTVQLWKLVNVRCVQDVTHEPAVSRDLCLFKVRADADRRGEILMLCQTFRARIIDVGPESIIVECTGDQGKIQGLATVLRPFGIEEMVQCGTVAMTRGLTTKTDPKTQAA